MTFHVEVREPRLERGGSLSGGETPVDIPIARDDSLGSPTLPSKRHYTLVELMGLFAVSFSYAFVFNTVANIVLPKEIERLVTTRQSMWLGAVMSVGAVCQLATPIVGAWSDRVGRRVTFLIYGTFVLIVGNAFFLLVGNQLIMLFVANVGTTIGLSIQFAMLTAMLNDYVAEEQIGKGSGVMAILATLGSGSGYAMFAVNVPLHYNVCSYILATVLCLACTMLFLPTSQIHVASGATPPAQGVVAHVLHALSVPSPKLYPDFAIACLGRGLFNAGLAGQAYLMYYFRDIVKADQPVQMASWVAVMALLGGIVGALPAGILSDKFGKKPLIYVSVAICIVALSSFLVTTDPDALKLIGFVYGVGNVAYLSVDYALGVHVLPKDKRQPIDAAKDLGIFAMSATGGQLFGQMVYGSILDFHQVSVPAGGRGPGVPSGSGTAYTFMGFVLAFGFGGCCFLMAGVLTRFIKSTR